MTVSDDWIEHLSPRQRTHFSSQSPRQREAISELMKLVANRDAAQSIAPVVAENERLRARVSELEELVRFAQDWRHEMAWPMRLSDPQDEDDLEDAEKVCQWMKRVDAALEEEPKALDSEGPGDDNG